MTSSNQINEGVPYSRFFSNERYIAYIPLLATAVALAYDVGFFYAIEISFFTLFSLSEHILFALQALPLVFVILFGVTFALGMLYFNRYRPQRAPPSVESSPGAKIIGTVVGVVMIVILILVLIYLIRRLLLGSPEAGLFVVIVIPLYFMLLIVETQFRPLYYLLFAVNVCLVFSFTVGYWYGKAYFSPNAQEHLNPKSIVIFKNERLSLTGQIIRSGDRGVLLYDPASNLVRFELWEEISSIKTTPGRF